MLGGRCSGKYIQRVRKDWRQHCECFTYRLGISRQVNYQTIGANARDCSREHSVRRDRVADCPDGFYKSRGFAVNR